MLKNKLKNYHIILASGSPRRQQFFKDLDLNFEIRIKEIEEVFPPELKAGEITDYLAILKSSAFEGTLKKNELLITSDTIVWHSDKALGKPQDKQDAVHILKSLSGATHEVITSVCFKSLEKTDVIQETTKVTFNNITEEEILYYIDNFSPYDKAGAYGIQDWIGLIAVSKIEGSYANVMGLPVDKVYTYLTNLKL
jgi:septum formation protein